MLRRIPAPLAALATAGLLIFAACQSQTVPTLSDPKAILAAAVTTTAGATSVRADVSVDGTVALDPFGTGGGAPVDLSGTSASADIDIANGDARVTFSLPGLLGLSGEIIAVDDTAYIKTTLTGPQYQVQPLGPPVPDASGDPTTALSGLTDLLSDPALEPVKGDDVPCGTATCYTVTVELTPDELAGLGLGMELPTNLPIPIPDLGDAGVDLTVRVEQSTTRLNGMTAVIDLGDAGKLTVEIMFSKWGDAVTITAPPADQVAPAG